RLIPKFGDFLVLVQVHAVVTHYQSEQAMAWLAAHLAVRAHDGSVDERHKVAVAHFELYPYTLKRCQEFLALSGPVAFLISAQRDLQARFPGHVHFLLDNDLLEAIELLLRGRFITEK